MKQKPNTINYTVNYDVLDMFKRESLVAALETVTGPVNHGFTDVPESRGESAYLLEGANEYLAMVVEGLGTENKIAEEILPDAPGGWPYEVISHNNQSTILNDLVACGADPLILNQLVSVGSSDWFKDEAARRRFIDAWKKGCIDVRASWGGGETQEVRDIVEKPTALLAGAGVGIIRPKERRIRGDIQDGYRVYLTGSNGIHTNGLTLARDVADTLPERYSTKLPDGEAYGVALLKPAVMIYPLVKAALDAKLRLGYVSNITGHGWRKVMRLEAEFSYVFEELPKPQTVFRFIQEKSGSSDEKMYGTLNMGVGCAWMVHPDDGDSFELIAKDLSYTLPCKPGRVERGPRSVHLPNGVEFKSKDYSVR